MRQGKGASWGVGEADGYVLDVFKIISELLLVVNSMMVERERHRLRDKDREYLSGKEGQPSSRFFRKE